MAGTETPTNSRRFAEDIDHIVWMKDISYIEAILEWCNDKGFEPAVAGDFVKKNPAIQAKVQEEAEALHFIPKTTRLF